MLQMSPEIFIQLFTILGTRERRRNVEDQEIVPLPLVYALLYYIKETVQYASVLEAVKEAAQGYEIQNFKPEKIMTDFEKGIINACEEVYPGVPISCCFFHLKHSMYRKIQEVGLQTQYNDAEDDTIRVETNMIPALAFVPTNEVSRVFCLLQEEVNHALQPVIQYFGETYVIGRRARGRRRAVAPRYMPAIWNQYDAALAGEQKTNNLQEGWHNRFNIFVGKAHPDLYTLISELQKEQAHTESIVAELSAGKRVKALPQKKWLDAQIRMRRILETYEEHVEDETEMEYLQNLSQNIYI